MTEETLIVIPFDPIPDELLDGEVVVEAGAYEGAWTLQLCQHRPQCNVYAFEPATRAYKVALEKLKDYPNVILRNVALGVEGTAVLWDIDRDGANRGWSELEPHESITVVDTAKTLEPLGEIGVMHLNAEGDEVVILEQLIEAGLIGRVKILLVQWHPYDHMKPRIAKIIERLEETHEHERRVAWNCWTRREPPQSCDCAENMARPKPGDCTEAAGISREGASVPG